MGSEGLKSSPPVLRLTGCQLFFDLSCLLRDGMMSSGASFALLWKDVGWKEGSPALCCLRDHQGLGAGGAGTAGGRTVLLYMAERFFPLFPHKPLAGSRRHCGVSAVATALHVISCFFSPTSVCLSLGCKILLPGVQGQSCCWLETARNQPFTESLVHYVLCFRPSPLNPFAVGGQDLDPLG